jgi:hypothetical protein
MNSRRYGGSQLLRLEHVLNEGGQALIGNMRRER